MNDGDDRLHEELRRRFRGRFHDVEAQLRVKYQTAPRPRRLPLDFYVLHHSDGARSMDAVWRYHTQTNGWDQGGYAIGVTDAGHVYWAAPPSAVTYGAGPVWNDRCFFVVALGDLERGRPSPAMLDSIYGVFCACDDALGSKPWRGHRELKATACPGRNLFPHLIEMRGGRYGAANPRPEHYP